MNVNFADTTMVTEPVQSLARKKDTLPQFWNAERCESLLHAHDYFDTDGYSTAELQQLAIMALQDTEEPDEAGQTVLDLIFGHDMSHSAKQQLIHDLQQGDTWTRQNNILHQAQVFAAAKILHCAFPDVYPCPEIMPVARNTIYDGMNYAVPVTL